MNVSLTKLSYIDLRFKLFYAPILINMCLFSDNLLENIHTYVIQLIKTIFQHVLYMSHSIIDHLCQLPEWLRTIISFLF